VPVVSHGGGSPQTRVGQWSETKILKNFVEAPFFALRMDFLKGFGWVNPDERGHH
jgi:hypothetical protein